MHLISEVWNRSQQTLSVVGVMGFSQTKACSSLIHASAGCSLAQEAPWEALWLRLWRGKCGFHFTTTSLFQRYCQVCALIGFCWGTQVGLLSQSRSCYLPLPTRINLKQMPENFTPAELWGLALLVMLVVIIKVSNPFLYLKFTTFLNYENDTYLL